MNPNESVWMVGRCFEGLAVDILGAFSDKAKAEAACTSREHYVLRLTVDCRLPDRMVRPSREDHYFPMVAKEYADVGQPYPLTPDDLCPRCLRPIKSAENATEQIREQLD